MRAPVCATLLAVLVLVPGAAGFGSFDIPFQQTAVHSKITAAALGCFGRPGPTQERDAPGRCFEPDSTTSLAGRGLPLSVGAVEAPDLERYYDEFPHCTGGDLLSGTYPRTAAQRQQALQGCREHMLARFTAAAGHAARILDANGNIRPAEAIGTGCTFVDRTLVARARASSWKDYLRVAGKLTTLQAAAYRATRIAVLRAATANEGAIGPSEKCAALYELGGALHALQDAYAHGNWTDLRRQGPVTLENAPGLGSRAINRYLRLGSGGGGVPPAGWITACYSELLDCVGRVDHGHLAKDNGDVDVVPTALRGSRLTVGPADEERGEKPDAGAPSNFAQAVTTAARHTELLWTELGQRLVRDHGKARAAQMICALTHDNPAADCGLPEFALAPRGVHNAQKGLSSVCATVIAPPDTAIAARLEPAGATVAPAAEITVVAEQAASFLALGSSNPTSSRYRWVARWLTWVTRGPGTYTAVVTATRHKGTPDEVSYTVRSPIVIPPPTSPTGTGQTWGGLVTQLGCPFRDP